MDVYGIIQVICNSIEREIPSINFVKKYQRKDTGNYNYVIEVPYGIAKFITNRRFLIVKDQSCSLKRFIRVISCFKCQGFNHAANSCTKDNIYAWCCESQDSEKCTKPPKCNICIKSNKCHKHNFNTDHSVFARNCESLKYYILHIRLKLNAKISS